MRKERMMNMSNSTIQISKFHISGEVTPELLSYINNFSTSRRMKRSNKKIKKLYPNWKDCCLNGELGTDGEYFVCPEERKKDSSILDYNIPPATQPSLWCDWEIAENNGSYYIQWNGNDGFSYPAPWLQYIVDNFIVPNNLSISGVGLSIGGRGDVFYILAEDNELCFCSPKRKDSSTEEIINSIKDTFTNKDIINACDEILLQAHDIDALLSFDTDDDEWEELFEKYFKED